VALKVGMTEEKNPYTWRGRLEWLRRRVVAAG